MPLVRHSRLSLSPRVPLSLCLSVPLLLRAFQRCPTAELVHEAVGARAPCVFLRHNSDSQLDRVVLLIAHPCCINPHQAVDWRWYAEAHLVATFVMRKLLANVGGAFSPGYVGGSKLIVYMEKDLSINPLRRKLWIEAAIDLRCVCCRTRVCCPPTRALTITCIRKLK
jgi:hypothetical protein